VHCPAEEGPLGTDADQHIRERGDDPLGGRPVGREVVLAAQPLDSQTNFPRTAGSGLDLDRVSAGHTAAGDTAERFSYRTGHQRASCAETAATDIASVTRLSAILAPLIRDQSA
jgi:hypothetical protein